MKVRTSLLCAAGLVGLLLCGVSNLPAQSQEKGFTWYEEYRGSSTPLGQVTTLDTSIGYNFNKYFGAEVGLPVYFVNPAKDSLTNWRTWNDNFGDAYLNLRFRVPNQFLSYTSVVTGGAPTGSFARGFSTGRATITWDNHLERQFGRVTPFANAGLGNTLWDRDYFYRPYRTLGFVSQFEGGATYKVLRWMRVGASYYDVLPGGTQKIYSQLFQRQPLPSLLRANHGRVFETAFETTGPSSINRDNGYSGWLEFSPIHNLDVAAGYTRSVRFALDTFTFRVGVNLGPMVQGFMHRF
jgi:hypothetical protein